MLVRYKIPIQIKKLTSIDFGDGIIHTTGVYSDEAEDKFYWFVKSDSGCFNGARFIQ
jgi:hypothetical protein